MMDFGEMRGLLHGEPTWHAFKSFYEQARAQWREQDEASHEQLAYALDLLKAWPDEARALLRPSWNQPTTLLPISDYNPDASLQLVGVEVKQPAAAQQRILDAPHMADRLLRSLSLEHAVFSMPAIKRLQHHNHLSGLTRLYTGGARLQWKHFHELAERECFPNLSMLGLTRNKSGRASAKDFTQLLASPLGQQLTGLCVMGWDKLGVGGMKIIAQELDIQALREFHLTPTGGAAALKHIMLANPEPLAMEALTLNTIDLEREEVRGLFLSEKFPHLRTLCMWVYPEELDWLCTQDNALLRGLEYVNLESDARSDQRIALREHLRALGVARVFV